MVRRRVENETGDWCLGKWVTSIDWSIYCFLFDFYFLSLISLADKHQFLCLFLSFLSFFLFYFLFSNLSLMGYWMCCYWSGWEGQKGNFLCYSPHGNIWWQVKVVLGCSNTCYCEQYIFLLCLSQKILWCSLYTSFLPHPIHGFQPTHSKIRNFSKEIVMTNQSILTLSKPEHIHSCFFSFWFNRDWEKREWEKSGWVQWFCVVQQGVEVGLWNVKKKKKLWE